MSRSLAVVVLIACLAAHASAHGGTLHPGSPEESNYLRVKVASCNKWTAASGRINGSEVSPAATKMAPVDVKGNVTLFQYLYGNCSAAPGEDPSAGAVFNVSITRGGAPLSGVTLNGLGMTGTCAANGGKVFYFKPDRKPLEHKENKLWFHNYTTKADGRVEGNGANDGLIRTVAQGSKEPVRSMMIVEMKTGSILSCCDLVTAGPATTAWTKPLEGKGKVCEEEGHSAHSPAQLAGGNSTKGNASMHDEHDGHDHSGHNHSTKATASPAPKAKSAAGSAAACVTGLLAAAAAVALVL